jgi:predicted GIY-YIG superfamily endonuclease
MTHLDLNPASTPLLALAVFEAAVNVGRGGIVYLLHFDRPYRHAGHYTGWTTQLEIRLDQHEHGRGARLTAVVSAYGIGWTLARTWAGDRNRERQLKRQGGASRRCPICHHRPPAFQLPADPDRAETLAIYLQGVAS